MAAVSQFRVLTVHQPFAWALVHGFKDIENRSWFLNRCGTLLIHAAKTQQHVADVDVLPCPVKPTHDQLVFGAIIGAVDLVRCVAYSETEHGHNPWATGPYCWHVENPRVLRSPIVVEHGRIKTFSVMLPSPLQFV